MIQESIVKLVQYGLATGLVEKEDSVILRIKFWNYCRWMQSKKNM